LLLLLFSFPSLFAVAAAVVVWLLLFAVLVVAEVVEAVARVAFFVFLLLRKS